MLTEFMMKHPIISMLMFESVLEAVCYITETLVKGKGKWHQFRGRRCIKEVADLGVEVVEDVKKVVKKENKEKPLMGFHYCEEKKKEPA